MRLLVSQRTPSSRGRAIEVAGLLAAVFCAALSAAAQAQPAADYDARLEKGVELFAQDKFAEAAVYFKNLAQAEPGRKDAHLWLGKALAREQQWSSAREAFKTYVGLAPQDLEAYREIAKSYESEGQPDLARLWHKKLLDIAPDHKPTLKDLERLDSAVVEEPPPAATASDPTTSPPAADAAPAAAPAIAVERSGFWQQGIAGLLGARSVWWGRLIAVFLFATTLVNAPMQAAELRRRTPGMPIGALVLGAFSGGVFSYVVFWGIPVDVGGWLLLAGFASVLTFLTAGSVQSAS